MWAYVKINGIIGYQYFRQNINLRISLINQRKIDFRNNLRRHRKRELNEVSQKYLKIL